MLLPPPPPRCDDLAERINKNSACFPFRPTPSRGSVAATFLLVLFTLSLGGSAFAQPAPAVEGVYLINPPPGGVHTVGSTVQVHARFNRPNLVVAGRPTVALTIGAHTRHAEFQTIHNWTGGRRYFYFTYVVQASDLDDDGISIPANAVSLNGGSIRDADGNDADLIHDAAPDHPEHRVNGSIDPAATVSQVVLDGVPATGDTFGPGAEVRAFVTFTKPVAVTGNPRLVLRIGDETRGADLYSAGGNRLWFRHFVEASDLDDDGISIPANAVRLNRGAIRDSRGNDVDLTHEAVPDNPRFKVNGRLDAAPTIANVQMRLPRQGDTFVRGETLGVYVEFSEPVVITGTPQINIQVGAQTRQADLHLRRWGGRQSYFFQYAVQSSDVDADGISVPADALTLNGGSIRDADGNDADLAHDALPDDPARKVNGASGVPTVTRVSLYSRTASQGALSAGETVFAQVLFTRAVRVSGTPQLTLQVGTQARRADHLPRVSAFALFPPGNNFHAPGENESAVYFKYVVQPSDLDEDGVSVPADALTLNGGSIRAVHDNSDADLSHGGLSDDPRQRVDGSQVDDQAPAIRYLVVEHPARGVFGGGDTIRVTLGLDEGVTVTGTPRVALRIGGRTRFAAFRGVWGGRNLLFDYVVEKADRDDDGLSIAADAVDLNGGTIRDNAGHEVDLDIGYFAFNDDPNYRVDGRLTPVPALPSAGAFALLLALLGGGWRRLTPRSEHRR